MTTPTFKNATFLNTVLSLQRSYLTLLMKLGGITLKLCTPNSQSNEPYSCGCAKSHGSSTDIFRTLKKALGDS